MVDVSNKSPSLREAIAQGRVFMAERTLLLLKEKALPKGDVLTLAQIAGIQAAKRTFELIPLCHNILLDDVQVQLKLDSVGVRLQSRVKCFGKTGAEMEALTAVSVAALTIYDMCKALDKTMEIGEIRLIKKTGGKSGTFINPKALKKIPAPEALPESTSADPSKSTEGTELKKKALGPESGTLLAINISSKKGTIKKTVAEARLLENFGLEGDAHAGNWHRQISLLDKGSIEKMQVKTELNLVPGIFAENLTVDLPEPANLPLGTKLQIGESLLEITQIGKECHHNCEIRRLAGDCVMPREGIFARVLHGSLIHPGDAITILR